MGASAKCFWNNEDEPLPALLSPLVLAMLKACVAATMREEYELERRRDESAPEGWRRVRRATNARRLIRSINQH